MSGDINNKILDADEKNLIKKYPLAAFFVLAYVFFFLMLMVIGGIFTLVPISPFVLDWLTAIASWMPNVAAVLVVGIISGRSAQRKLISGWLTWRVHPGWYLFGLMPLVIAVTLAGGYIALGGTPAAASTSITGTSLFWMIIFNLIQGATGEELGWRGFALPRLQQRYSPLVSALILGLAIAGWHSILHLIVPTSIPEWLFWLELVCYSVIVMWGYNRSGSLVIVSLFHFASNFGFAFVTNGLGWVSLENIFWVYTVVYALWALGIIWVAGKRFLQKPTPATDI